MTVSAETYTLFLQVPDDTREEMVKYNRKLCISNQVVEGYRAPTCNVVWQAITDVIPSNELRFSRKYQVYGTTKFNPGDLVKRMTEAAEVGTGRTVVCNPDGVMAMGSDQTTSGEHIQVKNNNTQMFLGLSMFDPMTSGYRPIYSSPGPHPANGVTAFLTPQPIYKFWFDQDLEPGVMCTHVDDSVGTADFTESAEPQTWKWVHLPNQPFTGNWQQV